MAGTCGADAFIIFFIDDDDDIDDNDTDIDDIGDGDDDEDYDDTWLALVGPMLGNIALVATLPLITLRHDGDDDHDDYDD